MGQEPVNYEALSWQERRRVRQNYINDQKEMCWYCGAYLFGQPSGEVSGQSINKSLFPQGFFEHPVHLQHEHKTGLTEGAVHAKCNAVLWQYHGR